MKIVVYEHACGGGYTGQPLPMGVLSEGFAMLRCVVADFRAAGHQVTVLLDSRLHKLEVPLEANYTSQVIYADEPRKLLLNLAKNNDAIYIITPETGQTLQTYVRLVEETAKTSLNSQSAALAKVADKAALYEILEKNGFAIPKTLVLNVADSPKQIEQAIAQLTYPLIFKPADGTGCFGISLIENAQDIHSALANIKAQSANPHFIVQEYVVGESVSVSLLSNGKKAVTLTLNKQQISLGKAGAESCYSGGCVPFEHPKKAEAMSLAERVVEAFSGLRGYVGVDLVLGKDKIFVLEVNARLTTSYIGVRQVMGFNVAQALIDAVTAGKLPQKIQTLGVACFSKIRTGQPPSVVYRKATRLPGVISPPFPLDDTTGAVALLMGYGDSVQDAQARLEEAKSALGKINR